MTDPLNNPLVQAAMKELQDQILVMSRRSAAHYANFVASNSEVAALRERLQELEKQPAVIVPDGT